MKGTLYWITGLAGAGKTTIGNALYYRLKESNQNIVLLDGDVLKEILGADLGYTSAERLERAKRYSRLCKLLADQGTSVIICTIAMFHEIRDWNRSSIENYIEIFLDVPPQILKQRDRKGLYTKQTNGTLCNLTGVDQPAEFPRNPDIVLKNDGSISITQCVEHILRTPPSPNCTLNQDVSYWNQFYQNNLAVNSPSSFAVDMLKEMVPGNSLIDLGCGNGRDSLFFAQMGLRVTGIDLSKTAIDKLSNNNADPNSLFICDDFVTSTAVFQQQYDYCYSRFTIHAITENQETALLKNVYNALREDGKLFIEVRSTKDDIYGLGVPAERNAFIHDGHYRRFADKSELEQKLLSYGLTIIYSDEKRGFAPFNGENPVLLRIISVK